MNARADYAASLAHRLQGNRHEGPDRCENNRGVQPFRGPLIRTPCPAAAERLSKCLTGEIPGTREGEHLAPLPNSQLRQEMCRGAETVEAQALSTSELVCAIADQPGAQERRRFDVRKSLGYAKAIARIRDYMGRVAAVAAEAGEERLVAEVFPPRAAIVALAASPAKPRHANPVADCEIGCVGAQGHNLSDDFMLTALGDELSCDGSVVSRHLAELQTVDIVGQMLGHIAAVIRASDPQSAVEAIGMGALKARLVRRNIL